MNDCRLKIVRCEKNICQSSVWLFGDLACFIDDDIFGRITRSNGEWHFCPINTNEFDNNRKFLFNNITITSEVLREIAEHIDLLNRAEYVKKVIDLTKEEMYLLLNDEKRAFQFGSWKVGALVMWRDNKKSDHRFDPIGDLLLNPKHRNKIAAYFNDGVSPENFLKMHFEDKF